MKGLLKISRGIDAIVERLGAVCNALVLLVIIVGLLNVVLRYAGKFTNTDVFGSLTKALTGEARPQNALPEAQWYIFSMLFFLGFEYILKHGVNVRVDILYTKWSLRTQAWVDFAGTVLFLVPFCLIGLWATIVPVTFSWGYLPISNPGNAVFQNNMAVYFAAMLFAIVALAVGGAMRGSRERVAAVGLTVLLLAVFAIVIFFVLRAFFQFDSLASLFAFQTNLKSTGSWELSPDPGGLPRAPIKSFIIIAFFFLLLQTLSQAIKYAAVICGHTEVLAEIKADQAQEDTIAEVEERARHILG